MDLQELEDFVIEIGASEESDNAFTSLITKVGQYAEYRSGLSDADEADDAVAALMIILAHLAVEEGVDIAEAVDERMERMRDSMEKRDKRAAERDRIKAIMDSGDYKTLAHELGMVDEPEEINKRYHQ